MALITPNLDEIQAPIEAGEYKVRVTKVESGTWEKSGTQYLKATLDTFEEAEPKNNGRKIFDSMPVTGKGVFRLLNFYKACTGENLSTSNPSFDTEQLIGREVSVVVDINDKGYTEVKTVKAIG